MFWVIVFLYLWFVYILGHLFIDLLIFSLLTCRTSVYIGEISPLRWWFTNIYPQFVDFLVFLKCFLHVEKFFCV